MLSKRNFILFLVFLISCQKNSSDRILVAKVFDSALYLDQIPYFEKTSIEDSILFIHNFSNQWASKKILLNKAEYNFNNKLSYIDSLVEVYKESLLIHYYKEAVIQTYLDTVIKDSLIMDYYFNNIDNFELKESVVKLNYIKIRNIAPNLDFISKKYYSESLLDLEALEDYCIQFADRFYLEDTTWISWLDFANQLPEKERRHLLEREKTLKKNKRFELDDSIYKYFIFVKDFKIKGSSSPLEYVSSMIEKILLNKRKKEIIFNIENKLLQEAIENNNFEIYE